MIPTKLEIRLVGTGERLELHAITELPFVPSHGHHITYGGTVFTIDEDTTIQYRTESHTLFLISTYHWGEFFKPVAHARERLQQFVGAGWSASGKFEELISQLEEVA